MTFRGGLGRLWLSSSSSSRLVDASRKGSGRCSAGVGGGRLDCGDGSLKRVCRKKGTTGALLSYSLDLVRGLETVLSRSSKIDERSRGDFLGSLGLKETIG